MATSVPRDGKRRVAALQLCSTDDPEKNFQTIRAMVQQCKEQLRAELVFLPENFSYIGRILPVLYQYI